mmetsp:Transcript_2529/g.5813  ORF Transcript_2529/g.5813 Transcript_2529/m.5813 type:complete len:173 (-) Transcript_2529:173-691(-)
MHAAHPPAHARAFERHGLLQQACVQWLRDSGPTSRHTRLRILSDAPGEVHSVSACDGAKACRGQDLDAMSFLACKYLFGDGVKKDARRAFELWTEAANLGSADAHSSLGNQYRSGDGVEQDDFKAVQHWEKAACRGHVLARNNLGVYEFNMGSTSERSGTTQLQPKLEMRSL